MNRKRKNEQQGMKVEYAHLGQHHPLEGLEAPPLAYQPEKRYEKYITPEQYKNYCIKKLLFYLHPARISPSCYLRRRMILIRFHSINGVFRLDEKVILVRMRNGNKVHTCFIFRQSLDFGILRGAA